MVTVDTPGVNAVSVLVAETRVRSAPSISVRPPKVRVQVASTPEASEGTSCERVRDSVRRSAATAENVWS